MEKMMSALRISDLSTDEEEVLRSKINSYERKIDSLMCEVGTLKNEVRGLASSLTYVKEAEVKM